MSDEPKDDQSPEKLKFGDAMEELEAILRRIEEEEIDIDSLAEELERATALLELCRSKIRKAEVEVTQIVQGLEEDEGEAPRSLRGPAERTPGQAENARSSSSSIAFSAAEIFFTPRKPPAASATCRARSISSSRRVSRSPGSSAASSDST